MVVSRTIAKDLDFRTEYHGIMYIQQLDGTPKQAALFATKFQLDWNRTILRSRLLEKCSKIHTRMFGPYEKKLKKTDRKIQRRMGDRNILDDKKLTIGFARRFATYKRAALISRDPKRLLNIRIKVYNLFFRKHILLMNPNKKY